MKPIVRVLPHLMEAAPLASSAAGEAARFGIAEAAAAIANAADSASRAAITPVLRFIHSSLVDPPSCFDDPWVYLLSWYAREAGLPDG